MQRQFDNAQVEFDDIVYLEEYFLFVKLFTKDKSYLLPNTLKELEKKLPKNKFCRVHKNFIVAKKHILSYNLKKKELYIRDWSTSEMEGLPGKIIPFTKEYARTFLKRKSVKGLELLPEKRISSLMFDLLFSGK